MAGRGWRAAAAAVAVCTVAGCSAEEGGPASPASNTVASQPPTLTARIQQYREDEVASVMQVGISNSGVQPVLVEDVEVGWPGFAVPAVAQPRYRIVPGAAVDLPVPVPAADCAAWTARQPSTPPEPAVVTLTVEGGRTVAAPVTDTAALDRIYQRACRQQYLAEQVDLTFDPEWIRQGEGDQARLLGALRLHRRAATGPVTVAAVDGSVLLALSLPGQAAAPELQPNQTDLSVPVEVRSTLRCDGHALGESKQTFAFDVSLSVDGAAPQPFRVSPDEAGRDAMREVLDAACG